MHKLRVNGFDGQLGTWKTPDFVAVARAPGGEGVRLKSEQDIGDAVRDGRRRGGLFVIDAPVAPDVLNDPMRRLFGLPNLVPVVRRT